MPAPYILNAKVDWGPTTVLQELSLLDERLVDLEERTALSPAPADADTQVSNQAFRSRVRSAIKWLTLLGYDPGTDELEQLDASTFAEAVRAFQREADLKIDGWMGTKTWAALRQLVLFDEVLDTASWHDAKGKPLPALSRSMLLRLNVLDHSETLPTPQMDARQVDAALRAGLVSFMRFLRALRVPDELRTREAAHRWLYRHDEQLELLAATFGSLDPAHETHAHGLARVELWLHDHDVGRLDRTRPAKEYWLALQAERARRGLPRRYQKKRRLDQDLLDRWVEDLAVDEDEDTVDPKQLGRVLDTLDAETLNEEWRASVDQRFSLWDGLRRAGRWLRSTLSKAFDAAVDLFQKTAHAVRKAVRWLYQKSSGVLTEMLYATRAFFKVLGGELSSEGGVTHVSVDFDVDTLLTDPSLALAHMAYVREAFEDFGLVCRILVVLLRVLVLAATGPMSWLAFIHALVQAADDLFELDLSVDKLKALTL